MDEVLFRAPSGAERPFGEGKVMLASKEVRLRRQLHSQERFTLTARKLADFLGSAEAEEECLVQRLRDRESKSIRNNGPGVRLKMGEMRMRFFFRPCSYGI